MKIATANEVLLDALNVVAKTKLYQKAKTKEEKDSYVRSYVNKSLKLVQEQQEEMKRLPKYTDLELVFWVDKYLKYFGLTQKRIGYKYIRHTIILAIMDNIESIEEAMQETAYDYKVKYNKSFKNAITKVISLAREQEKEKWRKVGLDGNRQFSAKFMNLIVLQIRLKKIIQ